MLPKPIEGCTNTYTHNIQTLEFFIPSNSVEAVGINIDPYIVNKLKENSM